MREKKISVIVPVYNVEQHVIKCLTSLQKQNFRDFEVIVVNDGSTDKSVDKIAEYIEGKPLFSLISKENEGLSSARNVGIENASGKYFLFLDGDDFLHPEALEILWKEIQLDYPDILCFGIKYVDENDIEVAPSVLNTVLYLRKSFGTDQAVDSLLRQRNISPLATDKVFHSKFFSNKGVRFPHGKIYEDFAVVLSCILRSNRIKFIPNQLYCYLQRPTSLSNVFTIKHINDRIEMVASIRKLVLNYSEARKLHDSLIFFYAQSCSFLFFNICKASKSREEYVTLRDVLYERWNAAGIPMATLNQLPTIGIKLWLLNLFVFSRLSALYFLTAFFLRTGAFFKGKPPLLMSR